MSASHPSLFHYLRDEMRRTGRCDFALRATFNPVEQSVEFYIHPAAVSGTTEDFVLFEDPFNPHAEMISNKKDCPPTDVKKFMELLTAKNRLNADSQMSDHND